MNAEDIEFDYVFLTQDYAPSVIQLLKQQPDKFSRARSHNIASLLKDMDYIHTANVTLHYNCTLPQEFRNSAGIIFPSLRTNKEDGLCSVIFDSNLDGRAASSSQRRDRCRVTITYWWSEDKHLAANDEEEDNDAKAASSVKDSKAQRAEEQQHLRVAGCLFAQSILRLDQANLIKASVNFNSDCRYPVGHVQNIRKVRDALNVMSHGRVRLAGALVSGHGPTQSIAGAARLVDRFCWNFPADGQRWVGYGAENSRYM